MTTEVDPENVLFLESESDCERFLPESDNDDEDPNMLLETGSSSAEESPKGQPKRSYAENRSKACTFLDKAVCKYAHQRLLGVGSGTLQKMRQGQAAFTNTRRASFPKHPTLGVSLRESVRTKWPYVMLFLWLVYHSAAEILPTKFKMPNGYATECEPSEDGDFQLRYVTNFLQSLDAHYKVPDLHSLGPGSFQGPRRFLQHRKPIDLFYEHVAFESQQERTPAGLASFMRIFHKVFRTHLCFRAKGEHAECNVCSKLKRQISRATTEELRKKAHRAYSEHILSQWIDRQTYWSIRTLSQAWFRSLAQLHLDVPSHVDSSYSLVKAMRTHMPTSILA